MLTDNPSSSDAHPDPHRSRHHDHDLQKKPQAVRKYDNKKDSLPDVCVSVECTQVKLEVDLH